MNNVLLLGAGFSRNWGGWLADEAFEYLIGCPEVQRDETLKDKLWHDQTRGSGFEGTLAYFQERLETDPGARSRLDALRDALTSMFASMNNAFFKCRNLSTWPPSLIKSLAQFDAIFTLNQDILLEHIYFDIPDIRGGSVIPGMRVVEDDANDTSSFRSWARSKWVPMSEHDIEDSAGRKPLFKLHGSSNWRTNDGGDLLIMGGGKAQQIGQYSVLGKYTRAFDEYLSRPNTRLLIIGYGFRDEHINEAISRAVEDHGLRFFVVAPEGSKLASSSNPTRASGHIAKEDKRERLFHAGLIGASRRPLPEILSDDTAEFNKIQRFLDGH